METALQAPLVVSSDISVATPVSHQQLNNVQGDPIQLKMLKILQQMQKAMNNTPTKPEADTNNAEKPQGKHQITLPSTEAIQQNTVGPMEDVIMRL